MEMPHATVCMYLLGNNPARSGDLKRPNLIKVMFSGLQTVNCNKINEINEMVLSSLFIPSRQKVQL